MPAGAFKGRRDPTFDEKHDLLRLFSASGMLRVDLDKLRAKNWSESQIDAAPQRAPSRGERSVQTLGQ